MTIPTQQQVDVWTATVHRQLGLVTAGLIDLIDVGTAHVVVASREPSARDQLATDRASDPDGLFRPTPKSQGRRTAGHRSDPVGRATERWELEVQQATTALYALVSAADDLTGALGLTVVSEKGDRLSRPREPWTRRTPSGTWIINVGPVACRRATLKAQVYLGAVYDGLADRMRACGDPEVGDHLLDQAALVVRDLRGLAGRLDVTGRARECACGCGADGPPVGQGATRPACRQRQSRGRRVA